MLYNVNHALTTNAAQNCRSLVLALGVHREEFGDRHDDAANLSDVVPGCQFDSHLAHTWCDRLVVCHFDDDSVVCCSVHRCAVDVCDHCWVDVDNDGRRCLEVGSAARCACKRICLPGCMCLSDNVDKLLDAIYDNLGHCIVLA